MSRPDVLQPLTVTVRNAYLTCIGASCIFWLLVHHLFSRWYHRKDHFYQQSTWQVRMDVDSRFASNLHAVSMVLLAIYSLLFEDLFSDLFKSAGFGSSLALSISGGYMLADFISMPIYNELKNLPTLLLHHFMSFTGSVLYVCCNLLHWMLMIRMLSEISTPFLNYLYIAKARNDDKASFAFMFNAAMVTLSFGILRVMVIPYIWLGLWRIFMSSQFTIVWHAYPVSFTLLFLFSFIVDCLNTYWFWKLLLGGIKLMKQNAESPPKASKDS